MGERAKMSMSGPRRLDPDIFGCGTREMSERVAGIGALVELRAILAEVEPAADGPDAYARAQWGWQGVYCLPGPMATALADALWGFERITLGELAELQSEGRR